MRRHGEVGLRGFVLLFSWLAVQACAPPSDQPGDVARVQSAVTAPASVLTQHNDLARTGANTNETILTTSNVKAGTFGFLTNLPVTGQVYAQPLYVPAAIGGKNVLIVATEQSNIYAFNADPPYTQLWTRTFEPPWSSTACGNTQPFIGVSSTPVIDPATSTIYVATKTNQNNVFKYLLHVLDLTTGADKVTPVDMSKNAAGGAVSVTGT